MSVAQLKEHPTLKIVQIGKDVDASEQKMKQILLEKEGLVLDDLLSDPRRGRDIVSKLNYRTKFEAEFLMKKLLLLDNLSTGEYSRPVRKAMVNRIMKLVDTLDATSTSLTQLLKSIPELPEPTPEPTPAPAPAPAPAQSYRAQVSSPSSEEEEEEEEEGVSSSEEESPEPVPHSTKMDEGMQDMAIGQPPSYTQASPYHYSSLPQQPGYQVKYDHTPTTTYSQQPYRSKKQHMPYAQAYDQQGNIVQRAEPPMSVAREVIPDVKAQELRDEYRLYVDLPNFDKKDVEINVDGGVLDLKGKNKENVYFHRKLTIPKAVNVDNITANLQQGQLQVSLPKRRLMQRHNRWW